MAWHGMEVIKEGIGALKEGPQTRVAEKRRKEDKPGKLPGCVATQNPASRRRPPVSPLVRHLLSLSHGLSSLGFSIVYGRPF